MNLTPTEMQKALILWGRKAFINRMGLKPQEMPDFCKKHGLLSPADHTRRLAKEQKLLTHVVANCDLQKSAKALGISTATLKNILQDCSEVTNGYRKADELNKDEVWDTAQRTGSISLTATIHRTTAAQLKKLEITHDTISDPAKHGYRARTGRLGEMAAVVALKPWNKDVEDSNEEGGFNTKSYDIVADGVKINLRTTHCYRTRSGLHKGWTWSFQWPSWDKKFDSVMLVALDNTDTPVAIAMMNVCLTEKYLKKTEKGVTYRIRNLDAARGSCEDILEAILDRDGWASLPLQKAQVRTANWLTNEKAHK